MIVVNLLCDRSSREVTKSFSHKALLDSADLHLLPSPMNSSPQFEISNPQRISGVAKTVFVPSGRVRHEEEGALGMIFEDQVNSIEFFQ